MQWNTKYNNGDCDPNNSDTKTLDCPERDTKYWPIHVNVEV